MIIANDEGMIHHSVERKRMRDWGVPVHLINNSDATLDAPALARGANLTRYISAKVKACPTWLATESQQQ